MLARSSHDRRFNLFAAKRTTAAKRAGQKPTSPFTKKQIRSVGIQTDLRIGFQLLEGIELGTASPIATTTAGVKRSPVKNDTRTVTSSRKLR